MTKYIAGRLAGVVGILVAICFFTFAIFFWLSPDPAVAVCGKTCTALRIAEIRQALGLGQPFLAQFADYLKGLFAGRNYGTGADLVHCGAPCLGYSFQSSQNVWQMITQRLPVTLTVAIGAAVLWLLIGVISGVVSGVREGSWWDRSAMFLTLGGASVPSYVMALVLQYVLVVKLQLLPFPSNPGFLPSPRIWFESYLMPWVVLALGYACLYARLTRSNVIDTMSENFMRTARAKGLPPWLILRRHALRPSLTPITTIFGMDFAGLLGGTLIVETVFGLNGLGQLTEQAIASNDQPVIMGVTLLAAFAVVLGNLVVDILYTYLDPRVRITAR
jgi:peptide/nickel transport system permease protein